MVLSRSIPFQSTLRPQLIGLKQELSEENMAFGNRGKPRRNFQSSRGVAKAATASGAVSVSADSTQPGLVCAFDSPPSRTKREKGVI